MKPQYVSRVGLSLPVRYYAHQKGLNLNEILVRSRLPKNLYQNHDRLILQRELFRLLSEAAIECNDPYLGASIGASADLACLGMTGDWLKSSRSVRQIISRANYGIQSYVQTGLKLELDEEAKSASWLISYGKNGTQGRIHASLLMLSYMIEMVRSILDPSWKPIAVLVDKQDLKYIPKIDEKFKLRIEVIDCGYGIRLPKDILGGNPEFPNNERGLKSLDVLESMPDPNSVVEVVDALCDFELGNGMARLNAIANRMGCHRRTLQKMLVVQGDSFRSIYRRKLLRGSLDLLDNSEIAIAEVARRLGFSSSHHYARALKQLTGTTPTRIREGLRAHKLKMERLCRVRLQCLDRPWDASELFA